MKRLICACFLVLFLFSCAPEYDILSYQEGDICAECIVNNEYKVNIIKKEEIRTLEIISPSELSGTAFVFDGKEWSVICDEMKIPLDASSLDGIVALTSIFDLDSGAISTVSTGDGVGIVSFNMKDATYTVSYNELSLPQKIKIASDTLDFDIEIISITKTDIK